MIRILSALVASPLVFVATAALAQDAPPPPDPLSQSADAPAAPTVFDGDYLTIGAGLAFGPGYEGSDSYVAFPVAGLQGRLAGFTISPRPAGLALDLINEPRDSRISFNLGPVARGRFDRTKQIRDPAVIALGKKDTAVEVGGTAGFSINRITNPYDSLSFGVDVRKDVAGAHRGTIVQPTVTFLTPLATSFAVALNVSADHVDSSYAHYYFDVTPAGAIASGLPAYTARAGWKSASTSLITFYDLDGNLANGGFALVGGLSYSRLLGNFARSPIVSLRGSKDQFLLGAGIAFTF
ncbi:outer membrane scaffolding protein for murein synthesis (MipA/OmpV family) [Sphingobium xanthum]|uniref:MipA/OmpV family protein n=1 Tax=Sphingobium xanthum TaxID=1387165 RepID=UPI001C8BAFCF|nr:MipA/OmpV family protein [Sphingobium xanthum]